MATKRKKATKSTLALARRPVVQAPLAQSPKGAGDRRALGRSNTVDALFPAPPPKVELPPGYAKVLGELKKRIEQTRLATVIAANTEMASRSVDRERVDAALPCANRANDESADPARPRGIAREHEPQRLGRPVDLTA